MIYPPGQGKSGQSLMQLWRDYFEQYANKEEDRGRELCPKLRNGFCRLFELGYLLITHVDAML